MNKKEHLLGMLSLKSFSHQLPSRCSPGLGRRNCDILCACPLIYFDHSTYPFASSEATRCITPAVRSADRVVMVGASAISSGLRCCTGHVWHHYGSQAEDEEEQRKVGPHCLSFSTSGQDPIIQIEFQQLTYSSRAIAFIGAIKLMARASPF